MQYKNVVEHVGIVRVSEDGRQGVFNIEGLFPGYGLTLANSLRRVLLSSLPGAAITQFKVQGTLHEFSTIPNVLEDVVEISLNLKKVRLIALSDEPQTLTLSVKGAKSVTAGDIVSGVAVRIMNPDQHLFTMTDKKAEVEIELVVERGLGYVPVERRKEGKLEVGVIALDAIFTPVTRVSVKEERMRVGDRTDYNRVRVEIQTDGTVTPSDALHRASNILVEHFARVATIDVQEAVLPPASGRKSSKKAPAGEV